MPGHPIKFFLKGFEVKSDDFLSQTNKVSTEHQLNPRNTYLEQIIEEVMFQKVSFVDK